MIRVNIQRWLRVLGFSVITLSSITAVHANPWNSIEADKWTGMVFKDRTVTADEILAAFAEMRTDFESGAITLNPDITVNVVKGTARKSDKKIRKLNERITRFLTGGELTSGAQNRAELDRGLDKLDFLGRKKTQVYQTFRVSSEPTSIYMGDKVIGQYKRGTKITATRVKGNWVMITFQDGTNGWISLSDLRPLSVANPVPIRPIKTHSKAAPTKTKAQTKVEEKKKKKAEKQRQKQNRKNS